MEYKGPNSTLDLQEEKEVKKYTKEGLNATYSALLGMLKCGTIDQKTLDDFEEKNRIFEIESKLEDT